MARRQPRVRLLLALGLAAGTALIPLQATASPGALADPASRTSQAQSADMSNPRDPDDPDNSNDLNNPGDPGDPRDPARPATTTGCGRPVRPASQMTVEPCDTPERVIEKAANIVPTKGQYDWQQREVTAFTHFGMNTFTDREWGSGAEDRANFDPQDLDVDQWMRAYKAAGAEQVMLTAKHHDGFALWPTRYTGHSVKNTPWWTHGPGKVNPKGDILRQYVKAARKAGLKVGVYLSPADGAELPHAWHKKWLKEIKAKQDAGEQLTTVESTALKDGGPPQGHGRYGNGSEPTVRTIPTLTENDDRAADVASGRLPSFQVKVNDYDAYYLNQAYEIFTEYGPLDELWLDGANPWRDAGITQTYGSAEWFKLFHKLSPGTPVFGGPQGVRWVGNEEGTARETEWSVTPHTVDPWTAHAPLPNDSTDPDIGSRAKLLDPSVKYLQWYPAEADVSVRPGWYHHADQKPKTPEQLLSLYERSVGRNASLLLNVPPAKNGRVDEADMASLTSFGRAVRDIYGKDLRQQGPGPYTFDRVGVAEDIRKGQRVERFTVEARSGKGGWKEIASGTTVGNRRILALPAPVTADEVRVKAVETRAEPHLKPVTLHLSKAPATG